MELPTPDLRIGVLVDLIADHGRATIRTLATWSGWTPKTVNRDIRDALKRGCLVVVGRAYGGGRPARVFDLG